MRHDHNVTVPAGYWPAPQAYILAALTLLIGIAVGYLLRGSDGQQVSRPASSQLAGAPNGSFNPSGNPSIDTAALQSLLRQLETRPNDATLVSQIGNSYYDAQDYPHAIEYYQRALKLRPEDVNVRTDMGTAMWYSGDPDGAIRQFEQSLTYQPTHPHTLFNIGIVKWQGKNDSKGALQSWERLLDTNPNYSERAKVEELMQKVRSGSNI